MNKMQYRGMNIAPTIIVDVAEYKIDSAVLEVQNNSGEVIDAMVQKNKSQENMETERHGQGQIKKKRKFGSTRRPQSGHRPDTDIEEKLWKDVEATEEIKHDDQNRYSEETIQQAVSQTSVCEVSLGNTDLHSETETVEMIDTTPVILSNAIVHQVDTVVLEENSRAEDPQEITEYEKSTAEDKRTDDSTHSDEQKMSSIITKIPNDTSTYYNRSQEAFMADQDPDMERTDNGSSSRVDASPTSGTMEFISQTQGSLDMLAYTESTYDFASDIIRQMSWNLGISVDHLNQPTSRESELESTCSFILIQESKTTEDDVTTNHAELSTLGTKTGLIQRTEQHHEGDQKENIEETSENEGKRGKKDDEGRHGEKKDVPLADSSKISSRKSEVIEEENKETTEETNSAPTEKSATEEFTAVCSEQYMNPGLSSETTKWVLTTNIQTSQGTELSGSKDNDRNSEENAEIRNTGPQAQNQSKKKRKTGSTRRLQGGADTEGKERKWKDVEAAEEFEHDKEERCSKVTTCQAATVNSLTEPQIAVSEVSLGILDLTLEKEITKSKDETESTDIVDHYINNELSKVEEQVEIIEEHPQSVEDDEKASKPTSSDKQEMPPVIMKTEKDTSIYHDLSQEASMVVKECNVESSENRSPSHAHASLISGTMELISEIQDGLDIPKNIENTETASDQMRQLPWDHNISENHLDLPTNRDSELEQNESTCSLVHKQESKNAQDDVITENSELNTSGKGGKMEPTQKSHRKQFHGYELDNSVQEINEKDRESGEKDYEDMYGEEKDVHLMDRFNRPSSNNETESEETKKVINAGPAKDSNTEDFIVVCSEQYKYSGTPSQVTELGLTTTIQPSPVVIYPDFKEDGEISEDDVEIRDAELHTQNQSKKKRKFGSTRRPQGGHNPNNDREERKWKGVEVTGEFEHNEEERRSKNTIHQAATLNSLTEPQIAVSEVSLGVLDPPVKKEMTESKDETALADVVHHIDNEVSREEELVEIRHPGVEYERDDESTSTDQQKMAAVITEIEIDTSTYQTSSQEASMVVEKVDIENTENGNPSQVLSSPTCGTMEFISKIQQSLDISLNAENTHEVASYGIKHERDQKNPTEEISKKEEKRGYEDNEAKYGEEKDIHLTDRKNEDIEEESKKTMKEINSSPEKNSTTEDFIAVCSEQNMHSGLSSQTTELGVTTNIQQSPSHSYPKEDDGNGEENVEVKNAELQVQSQSKKKKKFRSTQGPQGGHKRDNDGEERKWKNVEATEQTEYDEEDRCSKETTNQALPSDESISKAHLDQPTNEDPELEKVKSTCSLVHIEEPKTTQENVMIENLELSTSGKRRKMGSTRRSHREPLSGCGLKESSEEINEKERESDEKDDEDMNGEEKDLFHTETSNISITKNEVVEEESDEIKEELEANPTEHSTTEDFIEVGSEQNMHCGLSPQSTQLGLTTNIQPSPMTEHSNSKDDGGNSEENVEIKNTKLHTQSQSKKRRKFGSTRRPQGGHKRDNDGEERKWKNVEATEQTEYDEEDRCSKETTNQAAPSDLLAEPQCVVSEESLGILHPTLKKDTTKSNDETAGCGMIDISHVISTDTVDQHTDNEVHKTEKLVEIIEEHGQSVEEDERGDESTSSDNQTVPPVVTEIQNDVSSYLDSTQEVCIIVEGHDMKSTENRSQVHDYATCGTVELISEVQDKTNAHEFVSEQIGQLPCDKSISKDHLDQPTNEDPELEKVESTCSLVHKEQPKTTQENVMTENLELSTSGKRRKMGSTRRSHREPLRGGGLKESSEEINEKERESNEKDNEDDVHLTERSDISSRKKDVVEEESEEIKDELKASPTEDSTTEDFIAVCSEQYMDSGLSSQTTELGLTTNLQPSPVSEHSDYEEDDGNGEENIEVKNAELEAQSQSKKKKKFGSTWRPQGRHRPDNEEEERKRKDVEATEETQHDKEEKCSKEAKSQAASSYFLTEPQNAVNGESLGILDPTLEKEMAESKDETGGCGMIDTSHVILTDIVVQHTDNEVQNALELVEIVEEQRQSVVGYERDEECTFSDKQKIPPVVTEIQNDTSTYNDFSKVAEECDIESKENRSFSQVHVTPICGTVELISEVQDSLGIPVNTGNTHEFVSEQIGQLPSNEGISKDQLDQPTNEDPELEKVKSTCSLVHIEESKTTQENVMIENVELSTSGKQRKMGSTRRSHREPLHGGGLKESTEEINEKERESNEKDNEDMYGEEKDVHLTETSDKSIRENDVVEESEEIKEELKASPTEHSTTEDFIEACSEQDMHFGLSPQTTELRLATNLQTSPVTEHSDSKDDGGNSEENVEIKSTELHTQNQSKEKRKSGSTQRHQGGHRPDNEVEKRRWKDVESTEEIEDVEKERRSKEATNQAGTSELLTEPQSAVSEVSLGILGPPLKKEMIETNDETGGCGIIDRPHVILTDTLLHHSNNEVNKAEELMEIIEECEQSVVEDERGDEFTLSDTMPPVVTEIENDVSTDHYFSQEASIIVEGHDMRRNENRNPSQGHVTLTCGTVELISEVQDRLGNPVNTENTHELLSEQIRQLPSDESTSKDQIDQPTNKAPELEKVESTCSLVHIEQPNTTQENVMIDNLELSTSGKRRKMGSTRRTHRAPVHGGDLKETIEGINGKERESGEKDDEDMYGVEKDVPLTERSSISSRKKDVVEEESEEIKDELKASPTEDSTTEDFIAVCSEQYMDSGLSSQTTELGVTTNIQPSPSHSYPMEDDWNGEENIEVKNAELHIQRQSKKKKKFRSTQRPQGGHRRDNDGEEKKWENVEATEQTEYDEEDRCSKENPNQAASSDLLAEPQCVVSEESLGILHPTLKEDTTKSNDETAGCGMIDISHVISTDIVVQHTDNEVHKTEKLVEIIEEHGQSVEEDERGDESTSSDNQTVPPVVTEIQNDVSSYLDSTQEVCIIVEGHDMKSTENRSQVHDYATCGTVELISEVQDKTNAHEFVSEQIGQLPCDKSISKDHLDQPTNEDPELEKVESTCSLVHTEQPKTTQENVMTENLELSTSGKRRKMGSTRRSHREPLRGGGLTESSEEINEKERESNEKDNEDDVHLTERSDISSRKNDVVEEESEEIKDELKASPTEDSTTEDFIAVCSEQYMDSGLSSQTTELRLTTNLQPSPVSEHSDYEEDDGNGEENIEVKNAELEAQSQSKKKKKFGSTRRPQGRHRPDNEEEERKRKDVEATEETQHDKEEKCSKEAKSQAASSYFLTEPQNAVNGESLGILDPTLEKEMAESKDETGGCGMIDTSHVILTDIVVQHTDNEVQNALELVEIVEEQRQSVVGYERDEECTFSDKQKIPPVVTEIQNDTSTYNDFSKVAEECDIESKENRSFSQVQVTPICGTVELISEVHDSLGIPVNTENTHEFVSEQIGQLPSNEGISKDQLDQPTNEDPELEKVESTCSLVHIEEPKTTQENVMIENVELSTSGKRRKMGSTRRSHREPLHGGGLKESTEEINEKERESNEKDNEDMYGEEKDVHLTETSDKSIRENDVVEESEEIKEELKASPTEHSTTEDFIEVCSEQDMHFGLSPQTTELRLATNIQTSPVTEHSDSKDDGGNSEENVEIKSTELHTQNQSKEKRKSGSTQRHQGGHRPDNEVEERRWKDVESTEEIEDVEEERRSKEATNQAGTSELLTEPQSAVSEVSLGILGPPLKKEMIETNDETGGCGIIDRPHVILTDTLLHHSNNEVNKAEELMEIIEECEQSVVEDERGDEFTLSDTMPPVVTEIENDVSTDHYFSQEASIIVEGHDMRRNENRSPSQGHVTLTCGTVEPISEVQDRLGNPVNTENTHELLSEQIRQLPSDESTSKDQIDQPTNKAPELEKVELVHIEQPNTTQENVIIDKLELSTSGKRRKMGSTRRTHRAPVHGGDLKETIEGINGKERESGEKDDEDMYGVEKDVPLTERSSISSRKKDVVEEESEEIKDELKASPTEDSTTEDFIAVCSEQYMDSGLSSQTTELGVTTNIQPSPSHSYPMEDDGNGEENIEVKNAELHIQRQSKKKKKFRSTQRPQGGHRRDNDGEEKKWENVEATEQTEYDEEDRCSKETPNQAASSDLLAEPQCVVSEESLGILHPTLKKDTTKSNDETAGCGMIDISHVISTDIVQHTDNEVHKTEKLVEIIEEHGQSVEEDERGDESTSSDNQTVPPVVTEIQNDVSSYLDSTQEVCIIVEGHDMKSTENRSQVHDYATCGTVELISEVQDKTNAHEFVSEQIGQLPCDKSISKDHLDQPTNEDPELEKVESTCSLVPTEQPKTTQENVMTENLELSTSGKRRKMGSTRRSHREPLRGGGLKESSEEINEKERESNEKDNEDDVHLTVVEEESEEIKDELKASPTEDSTTEDFIAVCSEQYMDSGLSSQTTELGLTTNLQPSPVSEHSDYEEDDGNGEENIEVKNAELEAQSQSKKKKKFGSTRRPQGRHRPDNEEEERKRKDVEATEETQHDKEEKCSKEAKSQAASSYFLTEPQNAVNGESLGILDPTMEKEMAESKDETGGCGMIDTSHVILTDIVVQHTDNEVQNALELVEIVEEQRQSVVGYERDEECTFSDKQKIPPVVTEIQNDTSTYNDFSKVAEECDIESKENRSFSQVQVTPICGTVELISEVHDSLGIPVNTENTHEFVSEQIGQLPSNEGISKDQLDQPTNEDPELEKVESTCSLVHIEEPKTTQENVMIENVELSTSGKRRKMGSTRRSHREPLHGGGLKESTEEINEKERESNEKDNEDMYGEEKDVHLTETSDKSIRENDVVEESEEIKEELKASPTEHSTTEDFIEVCSEQDMHFGLSPQTTELRLATNIQTSPVTEHSDSKDDGGNSEENVEIKSTELHTQNQSKEKRKSGSTQRHQGGHRPDNEVEERRWKDVESTEEIEDVEEERRSKEATNQAGTSELLTEPQSAVSEVSLGILGPPLKKEMIETNDETGGCGIIDRPHVILTDTLLHHSNNEVNKAEELMEIIEECEQSVVEDERGDEFTLSDTMPPVVTEIENDVSTDHYFSQEASIIVEGHDMRRNENRNPSQGHVTLTCGTVELISEVQDRLGNPVNTENTHELLSEQIRQLPSDESTSKDQIDQPTNKAPELEKVESTCSLVHIEQPNTTQENVMIDNLELSTSGKRRKMGSTRRTHRAPVHGGDLKETIEGINGKERESGEKDDEDMYLVEKDVPLTERSSISSRKKDVVEEETEEIKDELKASPTEDSTTEDFIAVCSEQYMDSGLSSQTTELGVTTNIQRFPVSEHSDSEEDDGNGEENIEVKNAELQTQSQSKEKKKFRSTRRPQGRYRRDNEEEERKWKNVEAIERAEHDEEEQCSKEANSQAASSNFLTEPQNAVSGESLGILHPTLEKEIAESKDETGGCGMIDTSHVILTDIVVEHTDNEVQNALQLVEIVGEHRQSVVGYERDEECTFSDKQKIPPVVTEIQNDTSTYHDFSEGVEECDIESNENRNRSQVHVTPRCGTVELISEVQDSLGIPVNTENTHELLSEQIGQLPSDESISKAHLDQPTNEDPELEKVKSTCSLVHIELKTTQENVMIENVELSTSGKRRKMGSTRRSHREPLHGCGLKESSEEINEKERESDEKDDEDMNGEEKDLFHTETSNISIRTNEVVEEESDEIKEELEASPTEHSTTKDFIEVGSVQDMHCGLSPQSTQLGLTTNKQPSPMTEHSNSKDDGGNSEENVEIKNTKLHTQSQSKKRRKFGSTRRPQGGHRPDNEGEEQKWKDVESTEKIEDVEDERCSIETTHQATTSELLTEPQSAVSQMLLGIPEPPLEKEMIESNDETGGCGIIDKPHVILTDTLLHYSDNEVRKVEELVEIIEEREQSVVEDETGDESTSSNKQKIPHVIKEIQNDVSTCLDSFQEASIIVKGYDMESHENRSLSQVHVTPTCGIVELISEVQDSLGIPVNPENAHELVSEQIGQLPSDESTSKDQLDQPSNEDPVLEKVESTCSHVHIEETKTTQENVMIENLELSTSGKRRKMGSTRRSHRERLHGGNLKETIEEINEKEREKGEKDGEDMYGEEKDVYLKEKSYISIRKNEAVEAESEEIKHKLKASPTEDSTTEDFTEVCSEQDMHSGLSPQTTELDLISNIQPSPVTKHSDSREDDGNSKENVKIRNADLQTQSQSKKKRKFGSTRRPQGVQRLDTEEEERWKDVEATEGLEHDEKERCSEETHQAVTSNLLTESLNAGSEVSLGILIEEMKEKESSKEQTVEESAPITEESNSEVERLSFIPTIPTETCHQSIERQSEPSESITIIRPELEKLDKKKRKMGSTRKNFKGGDAKKPWDRGTGDMDPTSDEDITKEEMKSTARVDTVLDDKGFGRSIIIEMKGQEHELQTPHMLDQSEGSLLGEIEYELKKSCQSPLNTIAHSISEEISESLLNKPLETHNNQQNILEIPEPKDEQCKSTLKLPASQSSQTHTEPSSPGRRRKMGSTRKTPRDKHTEEPRDESRDSEQDTETQDTLGTNSDLERETTMLKITEGGRRKFGSRRTAKGELMLNQKETEAGQVFTDVLTVDPYFIPGPESIPVSQLTSHHEDTKASPSNEQNEKSVLNEADKSTRTGLASLGDLKRSSLYNGSTGRREMIDFERWDEQIPDFGVAVYNVVMVGNCNVGKTSFIRRFQSGLFSKDYGSTIGVDTFVQTITLGNRTVKLHIWDTAGQERYHSITRQVFHKAQGLLLMYDITSSQSFYAVRKWISQIQERAPADVTMMLLGNKNDCAEREVQLKEGEDLSRDYNIHFMECSAATGENVSESMKSLAWLLVKQNVRREEEQAILQPKQPQKKSGCC
ncbi:uncharacterized protein rab44 isoform X2 [Pygocentrus nattereri]|uniref:uncharacterized protein rab44 isoform X2 n=1 Tax=Pygocentrus nattereri TaxID=42514 RepID=UPI001890CB5C|nr:uncharacterized protein rab44 isoform X2 [Pygocentrus nattereri]